MIHCCVLRFGMLMALTFLAACLSVPRVEYLSVLEPKESEWEEYSIGDEGVASYHLEGSRIDAQYVTDSVLNGMFPDDSTGGRYSTNPYTYGDWMDPNLGYVPNRFTVFNVSVYNYTYSKMQLDPLKVILLTDRGDYLQSYTIAPVADRKSLEGYYRGLRGISGNEHYRFSKRIGIVRGTLYGEDEVIFKGENYSGFIVFEPLHPKVDNVRLILKEFAHKFDASGNPIETADIAFDFSRMVSKQVVEEELAERGPTETTRVVIRGPRQILGSQQGDLARDTGAINSIVDRNLGDLRRCFEGPFNVGEAVEGVVEVQFTIRVNGVVEAASVTKSTVMNAEAGACIVAEVERWQFQPAGQYAQQAGLTPSASRGRGEQEPGAEQRRDEPARPQRRPPATDVVVVYPFTFEEIE